MRMVGEKPRWQGDVMMRASDFGVGAEQRQNVANASGVALSLHH